MTGPEHFEQAEHLLDKAEQIRATGGDVDLSKEAVYDTHTLAGILECRAQVHATLALAQVHATLAIAAGGASNGERVGA